MIVEETMSKRKAAEEIVKRAAVDVVVWCSIGPGATLTHTHTHLHTPTLLFSYPFHGVGLPPTMKRLRLLLRSF